MANDNHAKYGRIGFAVVSGIAAITATLIWLGGVGGADEFIIETFYDDSVTGLSVGSPVNFRGVKIGSVKHVSFVGAVYPECDNEDSGKVYIEMAVNRKILTANVKAEQVFRDHVARGLHATVSFSGITGMAKVELNYPKGEIHPSRISWRPVHAFVPPSQSLLDSFSSSVKKALDVFNKINIAEAWTNVATIASSTARLTANTDELLDSERMNLSKIIRNLAEASDDLRSATRDIRANPSLLLRANNPDPLPETAR